MILCVRPRFAYLTKTAKGVVKRPQSMGHKVKFEEAKRHFIIFFIYRFMLLSIQSRSQMFIPT